MTLCLRYVHVPLLPYISSFIDCFFLVASPKCFRMRLCCSWTATLHRSSGCTPGWLQPFRFTNKSYCFSDLWSTPPVQNQKSTGSISWRCDWITAIWGFWLWFRIGMWHTSPHLIFYLLLKKHFLFRPTRKLTPRWSWGLIDKDGPWTTVDHSHRQRAICPWWWEWVRKTFGNALKMPDFFKNYIGLMKFQGRSMPLSTRKRTRLRKRSFNLSRKTPVLSCHLASNTWETRSSKVRFSWCVFYRGPAIFVFLTALPFRTNNKL